jgi:Ca2+/H+ antiporter
LRDARNSGNPLNFNHTMRSLFRLFLVLVSITVTIFALITHQLGNTRVQLLITALISISFLSFLIINLVEHREQRKRREARESRSKANEKSAVNPRTPSDISFAQKERKVGLTWGGGNIKASEATRGTRRKFLGK